MGIRTKLIMWSELFHLSRGSSGHSLQQQIRETLVAAILDGRLSPDTAVPSSRDLSHQLGVARNTVTFAYQHLVEEGYLIARERSGYYINPAMQRDASGGRRAPAESPAAAPGRGVAWERRLRVQPTRQRNIVKPSNWDQFDYPFIFGQVDPDLFPLNAWRECYRQALSVQAVHYLIRDQLDADDELLVEQIQSRVLPRRGIWVERNEILVTLGAQNALYLLAELLIGSDSVVGMEDPGYADARNIFALRSGRLRPLPVDEHGLVINENLRECDCIFVTPSHQFPTTVTLPIERREALLRLAKESNILLIEDDYEGEFAFNGTATPALKSMDHEGRVLYLGSMSKTLDPGLRMGYLVAPAPLIEEARALRRLMLRHPPGNNQRAVALFLSLGHHDALIQRMIQSYRGRWQIMGQALRHYLPQTLHAASMGGSSYWVEGPATLDARMLARRAARESIVIEPGDIAFHGDAPPRNYFRLGFSTIAEQAIEPGLKKLGAVFDELCG